MFAYNAYCTTLTSMPGASEVLDLALRVFKQTFRYDFRAPGFSLISFAKPITSIELRQLMVNLKDALSGCFADITGQFLVFRSMARFDQQVTTKFHRDGGPDASTLLLGYEPTDLPSILAIADYSRAAHELGITPKEFERDHNPMFRAGEELLQPYVTRLTEFDPTQTNILLINNSCLPFAEDHKNLLGVMHQATIPRPDPSKRRIINSTMLRTSSFRDDEDIARQQQVEYVTTTHVSGSNYTS